MNDTDGMNDAEFLMAFEQHALSAAEFDHRAHLRMTWLYLRRYGDSEGAERIRTGLARFAAAHGAPGKYQESLTDDWIARVAAALLREGESHDFPSFLERNRELVTRAREPATDTSLRPSDTGATSSPVS